MAVARFDINANSQSPVDDISGTFTPWRKMALLSKKVPLSVIILHLLGGCCVLGGLVVLCPGAI